MVPMEPLVWPFSDNTDLTTLAKSSPVTLSRARRASGRRRLGEEVGSDLTHVDVIGVQAQQLVPHPSSGDANGGPGDGRRLLQHLEQLKLGLGQGEGREAHHLRTPTARFAIRNRTI